MKKINLLFLTLFLVIAFSFLLVKEAKAALEDNVWGWAWIGNTGNATPTIGWVKFNNCTNPVDPATCGPINYGVNIATSTGLFSDYAWSSWATNTATSGIGWISFSTSSLVGCPSGSCEARVNTTTKEVSGWARACSVFQSGCSGATSTNTGGWDGWIKLRGIWDSGVATGTYGVNLVGAEFHNWAWGGNPNNVTSTGVIGWISFNCAEGGYNDETGEHYSVCGDSNYKVMTSLTFPPSVSGLEASWTGACDDSRHPTLKWTYSNGTQAEYQVQIATSGPSVIDFENTIILDRTAPTYGPGPEYSYHPLSTHFISGQDLQYGGITYYWRVQVENQSGNWSGWSDISNFTTPSHQYPYPSFGPERSYYNVGEVVTFIDTSSCYNGGAPLCKNGDATISYTWDFNYDGSFATSSTYKGNATTTYDQTGRYTVMLCVTDSSLAGFALGGKCCREGDTAVRIAIPLPEWREIAPFGWSIKNFLSNILESLRKLSLVGV